MKGSAGMFACALLAALAIGGGVATQVAAQATPPNGAELRTRIEQRFDVLPLRDGVALRPKSGGVRSVEITGDTIALDGEPATGAELRRRLGDDAALVLQLSYLSEADRRNLFT